MGKIDIQARRGFFVREEGAAHAQEVQEAGAPVQPLVRARWVRGVERGFEGAEPSHETRVPLHDGRQGQVGEGFARDAAVGRVGRGHATAGAEGEVRFGPFEERLLLELQVGEHVGQPEEEVGDRGWTAVEALEGPAGGARVNGWAELGDSPEAGQQLLLVVHGPKRFVCDNKETVGG